MNFSVEVPGEANPLTPQQVYLALQSAGSSQQLSIQTGTKQLQTWETQRGYYSTLQAVYLDKSLPTEIRYLAIIQLKNGIDKYWRKSATNPIAAEEKAGMRSRLLEGVVGEADVQLALQNALMVSKVVRIDYPLDWPDVLTDLIAILRNVSDNNPLFLRRGLLVLLQIVKELSTARMRIAQSRLQSITPELVFLLGEIYNRKTMTWMAFLNGNGDDEGGAIDAMENSLYAIKIIRRLLISGYEYPHHDKLIRELWANYQEQLGPLLQMLSAEPPVLVTPAKELAEKHAIQLSKLHVQMAITHPAAFALLPNSLDLVRAYWGLVSKFGETYGSATQDFSAKAINNDDSNKHERPFMEKLSLKGLTLIQACLKMVFKPAPTFKYRTAEIKQEQTQAIQFLKTELLTDDLISQIANVIVTKFFVFRQVDLEAWEEDEDEWELREEGGGDAWEFEIRPCAEKVFMDIVINYKQLLVPPLLSFFQSVTGDNQASVVTKDAVYTAMGLSANVVFQEFDFDAFLTSTLVNDVQQAGPGYKVLRRRIAILLGQWITIKISQENRPLVYQIFQHLFNADDPTNDHVVLITATRQLKVIVDDFSFNPEGFLPYAPGILDRILSLIQQVEQTETKMAILNTIRMIAVRLEHHIEPFADRIVALLPGLWEASGEEHLLKQAILTLLSQLVLSMGAQSQRYHELVLPLIKNAVSPGSEMQIYLMEEALDLWTHILSQTPSPAPAPLLALLPSLFPLLELGSDALGPTLSLLESYLLLAPHTLLAPDVRPQIIAAMANILDLPKRDLAGAVTRVVETLIRLAAPLGGTASITADLHASGYARAVFAALHDAWLARQSVGPDRRSAKVDDVVRTDYLTILARVALADPSCFFALVRAVASSSGSPESGEKEIWKWLSAEWFNHFDSMANIERQKLSCLALTRLLEVEDAREMVLGNLQDYFAMWTQVCEEMGAGREDGGDNLVWVSNEGSEGESAEEGRKRVFAGGDEVHTVHTLGFVRERLEGVVAAVGGEGVFGEKWLVDVDKDVLRGFQMVGTRREVD